MIVTETGTEKSIDEVGAGQESVAEEAEDMANVIAKAEAEAEAGTETGSGIVVTGAGVTTGRTGTVVIPTGAMMTGVHATTTIGGNATATMKSVDRM